MFSSELFISTSKETTIVDTIVVQKKVVFNEHFVPIVYKRIDSAIGSNIELKVSKGKVLGSNGEFFITSICMIVRIEDVVIAMAKTGTGYLFLKKIDNVIKAIFMKVK
ncbi:hypothetical protein [Actinomyces sp. zg-332]|uniref:hypothetical protein n=1 Tax=Actinomyces sp. zg-332 TaxID=2708340 RepID=UPI001E4970D2|nr:hypothetical protein [Actinomyces sp. zg-332]